MGKPTYRPLYDADGKAVLSEGYSGVFLLVFAVSLVVLFELLFIFLGDFLSIWARVLISVFIAFVVAYLASVFVRKLEKKADQKKISVVVGAAGEFEKRQIVERRERAKRSGKEL